MSILGGSATAFLPLKFQQKLSSGGIFLVILFFAAEKRVSGSKGSETKTIMDDSAKRTFYF